MSDYSVHITNEMPPEVAQIEKYTVPSHAPKEYALQHRSTFNIEIDEYTFSVWIVIPDDHNAMADYKRKNDILEIKMANWGLEFVMEVGFEDLRSGI